MFSRPRSLRLRYTLRALLVFITLFMLWGGYHTNRSWKERAAEDVLKARGASLEFATHSFEGTIGEKLAAAYAMLVEAVWQDRSVSRVMLLAPMDPEVVDALCALSQLKGLTTEPSQRTPEQYARIRSGKAAAPTEMLPEGALERILAACPLVELTIGCWALRDVDCQTIASCPTIRYLAVDGCSLSELGLARLVSKRGLIWFTFGLCEVTGNRLSNEPGSPTLEKVLCGVAPVDNALAAFISRSPNVNEFAAAQIAASDDFVRALGPHPSLTVLSLGASTVTDRSLGDIARMCAGSAGNGI
jgi:hypothetical protein